MNYLLLAVFCVSFACATSAEFGFVDLPDQEKLGIQKDALDVCKAVQVNQEEHQVLLNYLYIAARSAKLEYLFVDVYASCQQDLAVVKNAQIMTAEERSVLAKRFAYLNQLAQAKSELTQVLQQIEAYIDEHEQYDSIINIVRQQVTDVLTKSLENRAKAIDALLLQAESQLNNDMLPVIGRFCKGLALEPELLVSGASLALRRVDVISKIAEQLDNKIVEASEIKNAMDRTVYFTLLVTHHFFKACYMYLYADYQATYQTKPIVLFNASGKIYDEQSYTLPEDLSV